ncbi:Glycosyltransferase involved in cell wall bisynthesis [Methanosarcina thermophila]|jgi:glycosyltransferase involved in cell wall biosynthesis|uniref:Glycosyltransferase involved in cell wall bisynthesis n=3 Tax=Methanosarcina thermophila TaxID=2210 RepID=A0A1I6YEK6_METTE|nr:glycosyltransferase family 1 protein [Methanosarcina thermophila]ALK05338.1 MAG: mannosyltransferase [Methanosarcina sp. 795]AKB14127.1 Glycosyltransferase [Methanosarcina thermophila TM-1]AKB15229.1 Glycosyltransferase [Methanosarcina thermophila CHTI-55]NLU56102.1 glycosyltransferase family 4 protein [Methanosarcina thermophila]SFT48830.1 Glycosyltransferase involved in cell wall bisynthesis [Methanosarcina thermophila]
MEIDYINGLKTDEIFGMSKYQSEIHRRLNNVKLNRIEYPNISKVPGVNKLVECFAYPFIVKKKIVRDNIKHITRQDLAFLLELVDLKKTIVTCHDIIPIAYYNTRNPIWKLNAKGLRKAEKIITVSEFSKKDISKYIKYPEDQIEIIPPAVDHNLYYPNRNRAALKKYRIEETEKVILYVGAEEPRKNIQLLINSFSKLKNKIPQVKLLKVGTPNYLGVREKLLEQIESLNLQKDIIFTGYVSERELAEIYNAVDLFVFPSLYEGFGIPPLEAMACGTPVITSNTSSLPEVVGDAAIVVDPYDADKLVEEMYQLLTDDGLKKEMIRKGLKRSKMFSWDESARKTLRVYKEL